MNTPAPPARISVISVPTSKKAIVFRRGPSEQVCSILWDRSKNTIEVGQWLKKGRIYPEYCDLSPDAKHMIYVAADHKFTNPLWGKWVAVSETPWLTAFHISAGLPPMVQGGVFLDNRRIWIDELDHPLMYKKQSLNHLKVSSTSPETHFPEISGVSRVQYIRAIRCGWTVRSSEAGLCVLDKPINATAKLVRKISSFGSEEQFSIEGGLDLHVSDCTWIDMLDGDLFYAKDGCIFVHQITRKGEVKEVELLQDLNSLSYKEAIAPYAGVNRKKRT
jgi:hypothetical protein